MYISQFLGDQSHLESQEAYTQTFRNFHKIFKANPKKVLIDAHPNYFVSIAGREIAKYLSVPIVTVQHHKAHFAAVLAENELFTTSASVLGFIWDGTGYGEDGQIWGSELMLFKDNAISHQAQLSYFPVLVGDKMSKEPRLSALSLLKSIGQEVLVKKHFTTQEWNYYEQLLNNTDLIQTSSMGRFLDGIVCLLGLSNKTSYESEGVMKLEAIARQAYPHKAYYSFEIEGSKINWSPFVEELLDHGFDYTFWKNTAADGNYILGICLGMQMLCRSSEEGTLKGLCLVEAEVKKIRFTHEQKLKVPHMGWNNVRQGSQNPLITDGKMEQRFYFVHTYKVVADRPEIIIGVTNYGGDFCAAFRSNNIFGVQFHPEKSHKFGIELLKHFINL